MDRCKVGVIGCGDISRVYLHSLTQVFRNTQVVAVSSRGGESARRRAAEFGIPYAVSTEELLAMELDIVVILTDPASHFRLAEQALRQESTHMWKSRSRRLPLKLGIFSRWHGRKN